MATVRLQRSNEYVNRWREYGIYIDGRKIGVIRNGETANFEVEAGEHTINAKVDWCSSRTEKFVLGQNQEVSFKVSGFKHAKWLMPIGGVFGVLYFVLIPFLDNDYVFYITLGALPGFLLLMYYITFGRKDYLRITKKDSQADFSIESAIQKEPMFANR